MIFVMNSSYLLNEASSNEQRMNNSDNFNLCKPKIIPGERLIVPQKNKSVLDLLITGRGNNYELVRHMKHAIFGEVVLADIRPPNSGISVRKRSGKLVAIKIYQNQKLGDRHLFPRRKDDAIQESPFSEIAAMQYLESDGFHHPNIVNLLECITDAERNIYCVMEYYDGMELYEFVEVVKGSISEMQANCIFRQILYGLHYIHQRGICHRDMSLENIMLCNGGRVVIIDFGLCIRVDMESRDATVQHHMGQYGKKLYVAPEILQNISHYNGYLADLWSVGVILFILLTGVPPVEIAAPIDHRFNLLQTSCLGQLLQESNARALSTDVIDLLGNMLQTDPEKRLSIQEIFDHPWMKLL